MELVKPSFEFIFPESYENIVKKLEICGRVCYKSEDKITPESGPKFIKMLLGRRHESVIEHTIVTVRVVCNRGVSHEIVRHRIASYSQESTRYCNYRSKGIKFIEPFFFINNEKRFKIWEKAMLACEEAYNALIADGAKPEEARGVLPHDLKTEIVITYNLRSWRHFFRLRTAKAAHPQMREIMIPLLAEFKKLIPVLFDDINPE